MNDNNVEIKGKSRYATIDFLRGLAIVMMLFLHSLLRWVDVNGVIDEIQGEGDITLFTMWFMIVSVFFGGWCGFFLLISAIGNMISQQKALEMGSNPTSIFFKQIVGGIILLFFAALSEGFIGYHSGLGEMVQYWFSPESISEAKELMFDDNRWAHFETIHAVAWCIIINGIVNYFLAIKGGFKKYRRNQIIYFILAILIIALTIPAWNFGLEYGDPNLREDSFGELLKLFIFQIFDRVPEPLFPFLSISFIGSIYGIWIVRTDQDGKEKNKFVKKNLIIALIIFFIGLIGTLYIAFFDTYVDEKNHSAFFQLYRNSFSVYNFWQYGNQTYWLFWFMCLTGAQIASVFIVLRLVELRGRGQWFASKTAYFRRYGIVAFSVYNFQFLDLIFVRLYTLLPFTPEWNDGEVTFGVWEMWVVIIGIMLTINLILKLWEKVGYVFSLEWMISKIGSLLIPTKKTKGDEENRISKIDEVLLISGVLGIILFPIVYLADKLPYNAYVGLSTICVMFVFNAMTNKKWWYDPRMDMKLMLYNIQAINLRDAEDVNHKGFEDSRIARKLSYLGMIFFPLAISSFVICKEAAESEEDNPYLRTAKKISSIFVGITAAIIIASLFITAATLGISSLF